MNRPTGASDRPMFRLTLKAQRRDVPADIRIRQALKVLGRAFGLRCERIEELKPSGLSDGCCAAGGDRPRIESTDGPAR
jgi:hypothetical protein